MSESTNESLSNLNTDYLDLFLLHWPQPFDEASIADTWRSLEVLLESEKVKAIGVSNFLERHLGKLHNDTLFLTAHAYFRITQIGDTSFKSTIKINFSRRLPLFLM